MWCSYSRPIDSTTIYMACVTVKQLYKPSAEGGGGLTGGSIGTAPIWRRPDEILSIAHVLRDHVVLIQPSNRQYDNIHGLRNGKTVTNRPRTEGWGVRVDETLHKVYCKLRESRQFHFVQIFMQSKDLVGFSTTRTQKHKCKGSTNRYNLWIVQKT